jgi:hypothetical protein
MKDTIDWIFGYLFPTKLTPRGEVLFAITWEDSFYQRKERHGYGFWEN